MADWYHMDDFKKTFSAGDVICRGKKKGVGTGYPVVITAIGIKRFLSRPLGEPNGNETVSTVITCGEIPFRHWNPALFPDSQYAYALEREKAVVQTERVEAVVEHYRVGEA